MLKCTLGKWKHSTNSKGIADFIGMNLIWYNEERSLEIDLKGPSYQKYETTDSLQ
jgi:hypothetical protein